ncbi:MAG: hypothetical protein WED04_00510 [Promethearchaeati archaeon SRVP18_Atabeyarchaeia-1]
MTNDNDYFGISDATKRSHYRLAMNVDILSGEERAYLLGLYFADGYLKKRQGVSTQIVGFSLQGNEKVIASRVFEMLKRAGLIPHMYSIRRGRAIEVWSTGVNVISFFCDKTAVTSLDSHAGLRWMISKGLEIPFIAGLIDGDGNVTAKLDGLRRSIFGWLKVEWSFSQTTFPFLVDFISDYTNRLVAGGASVSISRRGGRTVSILSFGRDALVRGGISRFSWKVANGLQQVERIRAKLESWRSEFLTPREVAGRLGLSSTTVIKWCKIGCVRRVGVRSCDSAEALHDRYLIPADELDRLEKDLVRRAKEVARIKNKGMEFAEVAKTLAIPRGTLSRWHCEGKVQASLVEEGRGSKHRYLVVPRDEVERLKVEVEKKRRGGMMKKNGGAKACDRAD